MLGYKQSEFNSPKLVGWLDSKMEQERLCPCRNYSLNYFGDISSLHSTLPESDLNSFLALDGWTDNNNVVMTEVVIVLDARDSTVQSDWEWKELGKGVTISLILSTRYEHKFTWFDFLLHNLNIYWVKIRCATFARTVLAPSWRKIVSI